VLKIRAIVVFGHTGVAILPLAEHIEKGDFQTQYLDLLLRKDDGWHGYNSIWRSAVQALETALGKTQSGQRPLEQHNVMVLGTCGVARAMVHAISARKGLVTISGPNDKEAKRTAELMDCRCVPFHNMYDTLVDVLVIGDPALQCGTSHGAINPSLLRPSMTVVDVSNPPLVHPLLSEAIERGCRTVAPRAIYEHQVAAQYKVIAGKELPRDAVMSVLG
jgi:3-dehydroquinate dehydratase / shikimate dehydrogenase